MRKNKLTAYGIMIKMRLTEMNQTQEWLIGEVKRHSNKFIDSSLLNRIMTGRISSSLNSIINQILEIDGDKCETNKK